MSTHGNTVLGYRRNVSARVSLNCRVDLCLAAEKVTAAIKELLSTARAALNANTHSIVFYRIDLHRFLRYLTQAVLIVKKLPPYGG